MPFRCNYFHETGHLCNSCAHLHNGQPVKRGFDLSPRPASPSLDVYHPLVEPLDLPPEDIYVSSSPTPYEGISKGELLYIEDVETCALLSRPILTNVLP